MTISVLLADDHSIVRKGICGLLLQHSDLAVIGEAEDGRQAVSKTRSMRPDVVLMDVTMPHLNGVEATSQILRDCPEVRVVALSMHKDRQTVFRMLDAGAVGYVTKCGIPKELIHAIRTVHGGRTYLGAEITGVVVDDYIQTARSREMPTFQILSPREREILQMVSEGKSTKEIASMLHLTGKTVEGHRHRIMQKLDLHSIAELTRFAIREGISPLEL